jgi:hypothetical protein
MKSNDEPLYWRVELEDATQPVTISGTLVDAIKGQPGATFGCHLSYCSQRNKDAFPHPCLMAAFTKGYAYVVTEIREGQPSKAVRYAHSYGALVELNDRDASKKLVKAKPEMAERPFILRVPSATKVLGHTRAVKPDSKPKEAKKERKDDTKRVIVPRGAFKRAMDAGLANSGLAVAVK